MFALFLLVAGTHFAALLSPGPDFFLLIRTALAKGRHQADGCACGIALANLLSMLLVLFVMALLPAEGSWLWRGLQVVGGLYFAWSGLQAPFNSAFPVQLVVESSPAVVASTRNLQLTLRVIEASDEGESAPARIATWEEADATAVGRAATTLGEICSDDDADLARLSVGLRIVRGLLTS